MRLSCVFQPATKFWDTREKSGKSTVESAEGAVDLIDLLTKIVKFYSAVVTLHTH